MPSTACIAVSALVRGLSNSGALNTGQMHSIYNALSDAAEELEQQGDPDGAAELRDMVDDSFEA